MLASLLWDPTPLPAASPKPAPTTQETLSAAYRGRDNKNYAEAQKNCEDVIANAGATSQQKAEAYDILIDIPRRQKLFDQAIAAAGRKAQAFARDSAAGEIARNCAVLQADLYWEAGKKAEAVASARQYVQANAGNPQRQADCAIVQMKLVSFLALMNNLKDGYDEAAKAITFDGANDKLVASALGFMQDAAYRSNEFDKCLQALSRLLEPKYAAARTPGDFRDAYSRYADCLARLKRSAELPAFYTGIAKRVDQPAWRQEIIYRAASLSAGELKQPDAALADYERVFTEAPEASDYWYQAQRGIVEILRGQNRHQEALQALRICLDAAGDLQTLTELTNVAAGILKEMDKNVARANQFLEFQQFGPAGKDGKGGLANPLAALPYPSYPAREQAFAKARATAGDDTAASKHRALTYIYSGHPQEALKHFADAFRRCSSADFRECSHNLIAIGARSVAGSGASLDKYWTFMRLGPAGPDGQMGTGDDLPDPFVALGVPARAPADDGGLAAPPDADRKALIELRGSLEQLAAFEKDDVGLRREALGALARAHVALSDWGMADKSGRKDWYLRLLLAEGPPSPCQLELADGAQAEARASDLHLGNVRAMWRQVDAAVQAGTFRIGPAQQVRNNFEQFLKSIEKPQSMAPKIPPLRN
ncbi:MAG: tetratricopeptide repeat protein [Phycisphaerae bacterium]